MFAVLPRFLYRSNYEDVVYIYDHGSCNRVFGLPYVALEFATSTIRASDGAFALIQTDPKYCAYAEFRRAPAGSHSRAKIYPRFDFCDCRPRK